LSEQYSSIMYVRARGCSFEGVYQLPCKDIFMYDGIDGDFTERFYIALLVVYSCYRYVPMCDMYISLQLPVKGLIALSMGLIDETKQSGGEPEIA